MTTDLLKEHTREVHAATEKQLVGFIKRIDKPEDYSTLLKLFYGYFHPLEQRIMETVPAEVLPDLEKRRKTATILDDLHYLNPRGGTVETSTNLPTINTALQALGALYVLEGSTLGGKVIARMISQRLKLEGPAGLTFFSSYGDRALEMWIEFKAALNGLELTSEEQEELLHAAYETFELFGQWLERQRLHLTPNT